MVLLESWVCLVVFFFPSQMRNASWIIPLLPCSLFPKKTFSVGESGESFLSAACVEQAGCQHIAPVCCRIPVTALRASISSCTQILFQVVIKDMSCIWILESLSKACRAESASQLERSVLRFWVMAHHSSHMHPWTKYWDFSSFMANVLCIVVK